MLGVPAVNGELKMRDPEDEAFDEIYKAQQRRVATGVTAPDDGRNAVLEEVAQEFDKMKSLGDTAASFAAYVRGMKT
jgi:hypothetical protein